MTYSYYNFSKESFNETNIENNIQKYKNQYEKTIKKIKNDKNDNNDIYTKINKKKSELKKRNFILQNNYFKNSNYTIINLDNGYNGLTNDGYLFNKSNINNEYLLKVKLPIINNYEYLKYTLNLKTLYSADKNIGIGITNNKINWFYKINSNNLNIELIEKLEKTETIKNKTIMKNNFSNNIELIFIIDKITSTIHLQFKYGTTLLNEWISDKINFDKNDKFYFTIYRINKESSFLFESLKTTIDYYYDGNINEDIIELDNEVCKSDDIIDYTLLKNRWLIATIIFVIFMIITYLTKPNIKK